MRYSISPPRSPLSIGERQRDGCGGGCPCPAAWTLSLWHGLLLLAVAAWALELSASAEARFALLAAVLVALAPALLDLGSDYVLELPLTAMVTLALGRLGWWNPQRGGRWPQVTAALTCLLALLVKQSALLVLLPALAGRLYRRCDAAVAGVCSCWPVWPSWWVRCRGCGTTDHHPWRHQRAVLESAAREGDPAPCRCRVTWYPRLLPEQLGGVVLAVGLAGLLLWSWQRWRVGPRSGAGALSPGMQRTTIASPGAGC